MKIIKARLLAGLKRHKALSLSGPRELLRQVELIGDDVDSASIHSLGALWLMTLGCIKDDESSHLDYLSTLAPGLTGEETMAARALEVRLEELKASWAWGGYRPGAGLKPEGDEPKNTLITVTLTPSERSALEELAQDLEDTPGRLASRFVREGIERAKP